MAKKQYDSPKMRVCTLDCKDAITTSITYDSEKRTVIGSFSKDWSSYFDS